MLTPIITAADIELFRAEAEAMMTDTCRIIAPNPSATPAVFNETTGQYDDTDNDGAPVVLYQGKCRLQVKSDINSNLVETTAGEREWTYLTAQLQIPIGGTGNIPVDSIAEMLAAPYDPALVGRRFNIQGPYRKSQATMRRLRVREVVA